jgi:glutamate N-acetyltransferase/amino-acid N-acetyltransferase
MTVTAARGFRAAAAAAGLKTSGKTDVALVVNDGPHHVAAAVFTTNRCKANPVLWTEQVLADGRVDAVVLNSGGANCYTGAAGFEVTHRTAEHLAAAIGCSATDVAVCSTGLIGERLDIDKLSAGVDAAQRALSDTGGDDAAAAIMTTDTHPKQAVVRRDGWTVGGMAKGAGMLAPALATMLVILTTDAEVDAATCDKALRDATRTTFDRLDSDGCMSTNDTVLLMTNGASGVAPDIDEFGSALTELCHDLAQQLLGDAEGSRHDVAITVRGAVTESDALTVARSVARSNLLKCAIYGEDPNWGRVLAAVGVADATFEPFAIDVAFNGVAVCTAGEPGQDRSLVAFDGRDVTIEIDLHAGDESATIWTNDLTVDYVHENSAYST